ncbi:MAG TPA: M42 family metallopeptidase [Anaerolineae bacterium]|nr:M42 family metallopeptidase [Anaerolineae bacterium]
MNTLELIQQLSAAIGPSGREAAVSDVLRALWEPWSDELRTDAMGNLIALQRGNGAEPRPALMSAAHMDEIALIVTGIEKGFLHVHRIGGMDRRVLLGLEVIVHGHEDLPGIIGTRPPHVLSADERGRIVPWEKLFVDVGLPHAEVVARVPIGAPISIQRPLIRLKNDLVAGKALDNRASVAVLTLALQLLRRREHAWDFYAVATVQEEVGAKGALTSAFGLDPTLAIALDVTFGKQADDSGGGTFPLDKGPTIGVGPNFHPQLVQRLRDVAKNEEIPTAIEPMPGHSGTDAWSIQTAREGIPCGLLGIPLRYMHQPVETLALRDVERTARLLAAFTASLEADYRPRWEDEQ